MFLTSISATARMICLCLVGLLSVSAATADTQGDTALPEESRETVLWEAAKKSGNIKLLMAYRNTFPDSPHDLDALLLLTKLVNEKHGVAEVSFTEALEDRSPELNGQSIAQLLTATPTFPPVQDLPPDLWKEKQCSACHQWTQADLCAQARGLLTDDSKVSLEKEHPLGREFKATLRDWARGDCQ